MPDEGKQRQDHPIDLFLNDTYLNDTCRVAARTRGGGMGGVDGASAGTADGGDPWPSA